MIQVQMYCIVGSSGHNDAGTNILNCWKFWTYNNKGTIVFSIIVQVEGVPMKIVIMTKCS